MKRRYAFSIGWLVLLVAAQTIAIGEEFPSWSPPPLNEVAHRLADLPFDAFVDEVVKILLLFDPSALITYGLTSSFNVRNDRLTPEGSDATRMVQTLATLALDALSQYAPASLSFAQTVAFQTLREFLEPIAALNPLEPLFWPSVNPTFGASVFQLEAFYENAFPTTTSDDLDDFIVTLWQVDDLIAGWIEEIQIATEAGILPPRVTALHVVKDTLLDYRSARIIEQHPYYQIGMNLLSSVSNLPTDFGDDFIDRLTEVIRDSIVPAFDRLYQKIDGVMRYAPWDMNWQTHSAWPAYYRSQLGRVLGIEFDPETILAMALAEVDRLSVELRAQSPSHVDANAPISAIVTRLHDTEYGCVIFNGDQVLHASQELITLALESSTPLLLWQPQQLPQIVFTDYPSPYFNPAPFDKTTADAFAIPQNAEYKAYSLPRLVHHETIPGHYLQIATSRQSDIPLLQQLNGWSGYAEGWAEYACHVAYEQGWYQSDPCALLGFLEMQLTIAALTAIETGLLSLTWSLNEAVDYAQTIFELPAAVLESILVDFFYEPVQYVPYFIGRMIILDQRARAKNQLGDAFDMAEFHHAILQYGNVPLALIEVLVNEYIKQGLRESMLPE